MTLTLYQCESVPERLNKEEYLKKMIELKNVTPLEADSILNARFKLRFKNEVFNSNYCYCTETGRYYYITDIQTETANRIIIDCRVDVLYTFKDAILNSESWIEVAGSTPDSEQDFLKNNYPFQENAETLGVDFPGEPFTQSGYNVLFIMSP